MYKLTPFFLFFIFFISLLLVSPNFTIQVSAVNTTIVTWEFFNDGASSGSNNFISFERMEGTDFIVTNNDYVHSAPQSLIIGGVDASMGYINLTYEYSYIQTITFYIKFYITAGQSSDADIKIIFRNDTTSVMYFQLQEVGGSSFCFYDSTNTKTVLESGYSDNTWYKRKIVATHITGNSFNYSIYDEFNDLQATTIDSCHIVDDWSNFSYIQTYADTQDYLMYLDDIIIDPTIGGGYGDDEIYISGYQGFGCGCNDLFYVTTDKYIEQHFNLPIKGTIHIYDLFVDDGYIQVYDITKYELYVNGHFQGQPNSIVDVGSCARFRWKDIDVFVDNENIVFELKSMDTNINYWRVSYTTQDCFNDGLGPFLTHGVDAFHGDGLNMMGPYELWRSTMDISSTFYMTLDDFEPVTPIPDIPPFDDLEFNGEGYLGIHPQYNIENYFQNTSVMITYNLANLLYTSYMYIHYENVETGHAQFFSPKRLDSYGSIVGFVPYNIGNYTVTIIRNSIEVANRTFYSSENPHLYQIWSIPRITNRYASYEVFYKYMNTEKNGLICVYSIGDIYAYNIFDIGGYLRDTVNLNSVTDASQSFYIDSTGVNSFLFSSIIFNKEVDIWRIFVEIRNNTYEAVGPIHRHYTYLKMVENSLRVSCGDGESYMIPTGESFVTANFIYSHAYVGGEVALFFNNQKIKDVGDYNKGQASYRISDVGYYRASLRVFINNTWYPLKNVTFGVYQEVGVEEQKPFTYYLKQYLNGEQRFMLGLLIIVLCIFSPIYLNYKLGLVNGKGDIARTMAHIPEFIYVFMAIVGFAIGIYLELFELWYIVLMVFVISCVVAWVVFGKMGYNNG